MKEGQPYWRYFRVTDPEFNQQMQAMREQTEAVAKQWQALATLYNAQGVKTWSHDGSFAGFVMAGTVDTEVYRVFNGLAIPKKGNETGKAIWRLVKKVPKSPNNNSILEQFGLTWALPMDTVDGVHRYATVSGFYEEGIWFVKVPSRHFCEATLDAVQQIFAETGAMHADHKQALWKTPKGWKEVKNWQFVREWDELELANA